MPTRCKINVALFVLLLVAPMSCFGGGWGLESGRASAADAAKLVVDQVAIRRAQTRIAEAVSGPTLAERQAALAGAGNGSGIDDRVDSVYEWWLKSVMEPAKAVVANPAASCEEAAASMFALLSMMKQRNLVGLTTEFQHLYDEIQIKGYQRCREEAFDECMITGRFKQIVDLARSQRRSEELGGGDASGAEEWADASLKQCAIYDLQFASTTTTSQIFNLETVRRSKITLKFKLENGIAVALMNGQEMTDLLNGETIGDVLLDSSKCSQPPLDVRCKPGEILTQNFAKVITLDLKHRQFYVDGAGMSRVRIVGEDKFAFEFGGGMYNVDAQVIVPRFGPVPIPMKAIGYGFYIAHNKDRMSQGAAGVGGSTVKVERNKRGVYPVLFDFIYADRGTESNASVSDSTEFKLVHKPKASEAPAGPKPKEEPRRILRPNRRIRRNG